MRENYRFDEYIEYLREALINLVEYKERTGHFEPKLLEVKEALFNEDPFVVFSASVAATLILSDKFIYH